MNRFHLFAGSGFGSVSGTWMRHPDPDVYRAPSLPVLDFFVMRRKLMRYRNDLLKVSE
jgi:hypothetical protein